MIRLWRSLMFCFAAARLCEAALVDYVNPLRGSNAGGAYSYGATVPAVSLPFGFTFYTPMTNIGSGWKYSYQATTIQGFGISHVASPWIGDWGALQVMATTGAALLTPDERASKFSHDVLRFHFARFIKRHAAVFQNHFGHHRG